MPSQKKILPLTCAVLLMASLVSCSSAQDTLSNRSDVPTMEIPNGVRPAGQMISLMDIEESESNACPVVDVSGVRGLLVSPVGSYVLSGEKILVVGGVQVNVGEKFEAIRPQTLTEGFECDGKHWKIAFRLVSDAISVK